MSEDQRDFTDIALSVAQDAVNAAALIPEGETHLGGAEEPPPLRLPAEIEGVYVTLRIGRRPIAFDLASLYTAAGKSLPPQYAIASPHRLPALVPPGGRSPE